MKTLSRTPSQAWEMMCWQSDSETDMIDIPGQGVEGNIYDEFHIDETQLYELVLQIFYKEV